MNTHLNLNKNTVPLISIVLLRLQILMYCLRLIYSDYIIINYLENKGKNKFIKYLYM